MIQCFFGVGGAAGLQLLRQLRIGDGQDLGCEQRGVHGSVDRHRGDGDAGGHLYGGQQRVQAVERGALDRDADHGQRGVRRDRAGEVGGFSGGADQYAEAVFPRRNRKGARLLRRPVRRENVHLSGHTETFQRLDGFFNDGQVAVTAHDNSYFVQGFVLPEKKIGQPRSLCSLSQDPLPPVQN